MDGEKKQSAAVERNPVPPLENPHEFDYSLGDDYLELDDLTDPESRSSTSSNSSCMPVSSEEYFDPEALFRETDEVDKDSVISEDMTMRPATIGSLECSSGSNSSIKGTRNHDHSAGSQQACSKNRGTQTPQSASLTSSSGHQAVDEGENNGAVTRRKKLTRKNFCRMPPLSK